LREAQQLLRFAQPWFPFGKQLFPEGKSWFPKFCFAKPSFALPYIAYITFGYVKKAMMAFEGAIDCPL